MFELPTMMAALDAAKQASLLYFSLISLAILPADGRAKLLALADAPWRRASKPAPGSSSRRVLTEPLGRAAIASGVPFLPGTVNAGDMRGLDMGLTHFKFFPAEASGGLPALKALAAPFSHVRFCPTGGITLASAPQWLATPSFYASAGAGS